MLLCSGNKLKNKFSEYEKSVVLTSSPKRIFRKDMRSPRIYPFLMQHKNAGGFFFAPLKGTLTIEAALVLPLFLFFMVAVLQYGRCMEAAVQFGSAMAQTGKTMAVTAYVTKYGGNGGKASEVTAGALSAAYAQHQVLSKTSDTSCIKNANMLLSSFLQEDEMIELVLTYQIRTPIGSIRLPGNFFIQCAKVRAWTGRTVGSEKGAQEDADRSTDYVYVTITGTVYHEDSECTHLKLSVREVAAASLDKLRNNNGEIYHVCERCGNFGSSTVYITNEGNRYHSSLSCSGLKRTVRKISKDEIGQMRSCSKCGTH